MTEIIELNDVNILPTDAEPGGNGGGSKDVQQKTAEGTGINRVKFFAADDDTERQLRKIGSYPGARVGSDGGRASKLELLRPESCPDGPERLHISICQVLTYNFVVFAVLDLSCS